MERNEITEFFKNNAYLGEEAMQDTVSLEPEKNYASYQIIGTRKKQEDRIGVEEKPGQLLAVVCDGMGGLAGGEQASAEAVNRLLADYRERDVADAGQFLLEEAIKLDILVNEMENEEKQRLGAGTTLVAVLVQRGKLYYVSVGDSRIYLMRGKEMVMLTEDHNYGLLLRRALENGTMDEEEFRRESRQAEALISYIGMGGLRAVSYNGTEPVRLKQGDKILLCSDGLYKSLTDETIAHELRYCTLETMEDTVRRLAEMAAESAAAQNRKQDNTSMILIIES